MLRRLGAAVALVVLVAAVAWADGGVFPVKRAVGAIDVRTPDQRALLTFANGVETLVVETTVQGEGRDFAWVLPLPAAPQVEASTPGVFPTLEVLCADEVWTDAPHRWAALLGAGLVAAGAILLAKRRAERAAAAACVLGGVLVLAGAMDVPRMQSYGDGAELTFGKGDDGGRASGVRVLSRETVGVFDTTVLAATDAGDLVRWLDANGFDAPAAIGPVVEEYVREGWVFVASKVRADADSADVRRIHPLAFTFETEAPVYPMRLTGAVNPSLDLDLFVFGDDRAEAEGLDVVHCDVYGDATRWTRHPELGQRIRHTRVVTRLQGTLDAGAMRADVRPRWVHPESWRRTWYDEASATVFAANWGAAVLAAALAAAAALVPRRPRRQERAAAPRAPWVVLGLGVAGAFTTGAVVHANLPRLPSSAYVRELAAFDDEPPSPRRPFLADAAAARAWFARHVDGRRNLATGGRVREEDSPGNYVIREDAGGAYVRWYWHDGAANEDELCDFGLVDADTPCVLLLGRVRTPDGAPAVGAEVRATRAAPDGDRRPRRSVEATTNDAGAFSVRVPAGFACDLVVTAREHPRAVVRGVRPADGAAPLDVVLPRGRTVRGRVLDAAGRPVDASHLGCKVPVPDVPGFDVDVAADGTFEIRGVPETAPSLRVTVHVHGPDESECPRAEFGVPCDGSPAELRLR